MSGYLAEIKRQREAILLGEIGALLHMFGKCSSDFIQYYSKDVSKEDAPKDTHQELKHMPLLKDQLKSPQLKSKFSLAFSTNREELNGDYTDLITRYRGWGDRRPNSTLTRFLNTCHGKTSADEKGGVVRVSQQQELEDTWITTPFGHKVEKLDLDKLEKSRQDMDEELAKCFDAYLSGDASIDTLRGNTVRILKRGLSHTLGETRRPANDVSLWAQSYGVASLYKPTLAEFVLNGITKESEVNWRLMGIGWNGAGFLDKAFKPADISNRQMILDGISQKLREVIEVTYPLGNLFYEDINGLFFTFPGVADGVTETLITEIGPEMVDIAREASSDELWPFFTLSKPRRTTTAIKNELEFRDSLAFAPRVSASLFIEQDSGPREQRLVSPAPNLEASMGVAGGNIDLCPVCQARVKTARNELCEVCRSRRSGRLKDWLGQRDGQTIWTEEVADKSNRVALLTLRFDLSRWMDGTWLTTLLSQTTEDWFQSDKMIKFKDNEGHKSRREKNLGNVNFGAGDDDPVPFAWAVTILEEVTKGHMTDNPFFRGDLLHTFYEDVSPGTEPGKKERKPNLLDEFVRDLRLRINDDVNQVTPEELASEIFTQNASPSRLMRMWEATEAFLDEWVEDIDSLVFTNKPVRLEFKVTRTPAGVKDRESYKLVVDGLGPEPLLVICKDRKRGEFLTVDSLEAFRLELENASLHGPEAVQQGLEGQGVKAWIVEDTGIDLLEDDNTGETITAGQFKNETYLPFIVLLHSPVSCQLLLPSNRVPDVLKLLLRMQESHFNEVAGKLPIHAGVVVGNRKFPLYTLLAAGNQMLSGAAFSEGRMTEPWWETSCTQQDPFFKYYPESRPSGSRFTFTDLNSVEQKATGKNYWLTTGYFDFALLGSTADRHRIYYDLSEEGCPERPSVTYGFIKPRPLSLYHLEKMFVLWDSILSKRLTTTQRHNLEEGLRTKLQEWNMLGSGAREVFNEYANATVSQTFGKSWKALSASERDLVLDSIDNGLLLETLEFYMHVIKGEVPDE